GGAPANQSGCDSLVVERTFERHEGAVVALVALSATRVASAGWDGCVKLSDAATGKELRSAKVSPVELTTIAAPPDGRALAVGSWRKGLQLLDTSSLKTLATLAPHKGATSAALLVGPAKASLEKCRLVTASLADEMLSASEALGARFELQGVRRTR